MTSIVSLGRLETVALREAWPHEAINFTPWLSQQENLSLLADVVGMVLELEAVEKPVDTFSADILAKDVLTGRWVLIENQLESTDHTHLGQILTYAAGLDAESVIWIARDFREPHRAAIDYLNRISASEHNFFGVQVELLRIGESAYAPRFNVVAKPNDWSKSIASKASAKADSSGRQSQWQSYWQAFYAHSSEAGCALPNRVAPKEGWYRTAQLKSGDPNVAAWLHRANDRLRSVIWMQGDRLALFDALRLRCDDIQETVDLCVIWDRMDHKKSSMIFVERKFTGQPMSEVEEFDWFVASIGQLSSAIQHHLEQIALPALLTDEV